MPNNGPLKTIDNDSIYTCIQKKITLTNDILLNIIKSWNYFSKFVYALTVLATLCFGCSKVHRVYSEKY